MNKRKLLLVALSLCMVAILAMGGTLAYLTDTDSAKNVMTLGNVHIVQNEQQRDENGALEVFADDKKLLPVTEETPAYAGTTTVAGHTMNMFNNEHNFVDKIINVTNTGTEEAYVRTIIAFEKIEGFDPVNNTTHDTMSLMTSWGTSNLWNTEVQYDATTGEVLQGCYWLQENGDYITFTNTADKEEYIVCVFYYLNDSKLAGVTKDADGNDVQASTEPSLLQIYLPSRVTNEFMEKFGEEYNILALSQAVQTAGFDNAQQALDQAFEAVTSAKCVEWFAAVQ